MARLKERSGTETLDFPIKLPTGTLTVVVESPSIEAFESFRDLLTLAQLEEREKAGETIDPAEVDVDGVNARLNAYVASLPDGETVESMLVGPDNWRRMLEAGVDEIVRYRVATTVMWWTTTRSTDAAAEFWASDGLPKAPKKPTDRQKKKPKKS